MTATYGLGTYGNAAGVVTPLDHKMAQLGLVVKTAANTIRAGLFWDGSATVVTGTAGMSYDVRAFSAVTSRGATSGAVLLTNNGTYNVATTAAPGSNSRIDVVYIWPREYSLDGSNSTPVIGVVQGTPAASPTVPSLAAFPGAISLAQITVPAGVTATNTGTTITQVAPFTAGQGGVVHVRNSTERGSASAWVEGQQVRQLDTDALFESDGSAWVVRPTVHAAQGALTGSAYSATSPMIIKAATAVGTPDAGSAFTVSWTGGAFPNGLLSVVATPGDAATTGKSIQISSSTSLSSLVCVILNSAGAGVGNGSSQRVNYVAVGW